MTAPELIHPTTRLPEFDAADLAHRIAGLFSAPKVAAALQQGLAEAQHILQADATVLYVHDQDLDVVRLISARPSWQAPAVDLQPPSFFPWGLSTAHVERFVFVENADQLPAYAGGIRLGSMGVTSSLHLPLAARTHVPGALHAYWSSRPEGWNDGRIDLVRMIGHALLEITSPLD